MSGLVSSRRGLVADRPPLGGGRVAVVGAYGDLVGGVECAEQIAENGGLILGQRFGREQVDGARFRLVEQRLQHRQVVA